MVAYKYIVDCLQGSSIYEEFETAEEAIAYAKSHNECGAFVDKIEVELNDFGEVISIGEKERIYPESGMTPEEEDEWIKEMEKRHEDEINYDPFEADEFGDFYTNRHDNESLNVDAMVEELENNESEVECKHCFDLFPKDECVKTEHGYLCKECAKVHESLEDTVEQDLNDDRTPVQEVEEILAEPFNASEMRKHEHAIKEDMDSLNLFDYTGEVMEEIDENSNLYKSWWESDDLDEDTSDVREINYIEYKHSYCHILQANLKKLNAMVNYYKAPVENIKGFIFNLLKDPQVRWTEKEKEFAKNIQAKDNAQDIYSYVVNSLNKAKDIIVKVNENGELVGSYRTDECLPEELEEYFNYPSIEIDDVELDGMDNAVVDCQTDMKIIAHSEDEKPLDCKMEKAPLEKPLTEAKKDDELPVDPEAAKLEVHTMLNDLVADEIEAINGYEEAKKEILDTPIAHKDNILDTIDHVEDEEKEHVDELIDATTEIPFDKEETHIEEEPVDEPVEEPVDDNPFEQEFPEAAESAETEEDSEAKVDESYPDIPFDSEAKEGDKIRIIHLSGEDTSYDGKEGVVEHIDGIGQLHGTWGGLAVIPGVDEFEIIKNESLTESTNDKYAIGYCFWDYGWYEELAEKNSNGTTCCTQHRDNHFCNNEVYDGPVFNSIADCIAEIEQNVNKYAPLTYPENIDYASGRKNGSLYAIELNDAQDGFVSRTIIFDCKAHKLVKHK